MTSAQAVAPIAVEENMENMVEERDNKDPKGDKEPLGDNSDSQIW